MLIRPLRPESKLDGINSGSWYHCLPIGIYHWLGEGCCIAVVCKVVCYAEVRPGLSGNNIGLRGPMIPCSNMLQSFTCTLVKWFFDKFPMFADSFSVLSIHCISFYSLHCPRIRCKLSVICTSALIPVSATKWKKCMVKLTGCLFVCCSDSSLWSEWDGWWLSHVCALRCCVRHSQHFLRMTRRNLAAKNNRFSGCAFG